MAWNLFGQEDVRLLIPEGRKRYEMVMETALTLGNIAVTSIISYGWEIFLEKNTTDSYHWNLLTLEHNMLENSSPALTDIFMATKTMMEMFNELRVVTDKSGQVKEVLNMQDIKTKYERVKKQQLSFSGGVSLRADQVYNIPETDISDTSRLLKRVQAMEIFTIFLSDLYGIKVPGNHYRERVNYLQNLPYHLKLRANTTGNTANSQSRKIILQGNNMPVPSANLKKAVEGLPFVNEHPLKFEATFTGNYSIDNKTGWLIHGEILTTEFIAPTLKGNTKYSIKAHS